MQAHDPRTPWMDSAEETSHLLKAQRGDRKAFLALLRHYQRPFYRLAFALTRDAREAVAITHAAVLKAKDGIRYVGEGRRFFPWIARIVRNLVRTRRAGVRPGESGVGPSGARALSERLLGAMDDLDPDQQAAVALHLTERLPDSEIEAVLQLPPGSARTLLAGARARLAVEMQAGEGGA